MKQLTTITIFALFCVAVNAPLNASAKKPKKAKKAPKTEQTVKITTDFLGCSIGKSNKQQVIDSLKARGYEVKLVDDETVKIEKAEISLGGAIWAEARFYFSQEILFDVAFISGYYDYYNSCMAAYDGILAKLKEKYGKIADPNEKLLNCSRYDCYNDKTTGLDFAIRQTQNPNHFIILLNYYNIEMWKNYGKEVLKEI